MINNSLGGKSPPNSPPRTKMKRAGMCRFDQPRSPPFPSLSVSRVDKFRTSPSPFLLVPVPLSLSPPFPRRCCHPCSLWHQPAMAPTPAPTPTPTPVSDRTTPMTPAASRASDPAGPRRAPPSPARLRRALLGLVGSGGTGDTLAMTGPIGRD